MLFHPSLAAQRVQICREAQPEQIRVVYRHWRYIACRVRRSRERSLGDAVLKSILVTAAGFPALGYARSAALSMARERSASPGPTDNSTASPHPTSRSALNRLRSKDDGNDIQLAAIRQQTDLLVARSARRLEQKPAGGLAGRKVCRISCHTE